MERPVDAMDVPHVPAQERLQRGRGEVRRDGIAFELRLAREERAA